MKLELRKRAGQTVHVLPRRHVTFTVQPIHGMQQRADVFVRICRRLYETLNFCVRSLRVRANDIFLWRC